MAELTESDWWNAESMASIRRFGVRHATDRKLRLYVCACIRQLWHLFDEASRQILPVSEKYADGLVTAEKLLDAYYTSHDLWMTRRSNPLLVARYAGYNCMQHVVEKTDQPLHEPELTNEKQVQLFRDIVGNPFRPFTASKEQTPQQLLNELLDVHSIDTLGSSSIYKAGPKRRLNEQRLTELAGELHRKWDQQQGFHSSPYMREVTITYWRTGLGQYSTSFQLEDRHAPAGDPVGWQIHLDNTVARMVLQTLLRDLLQPTWLIPTVISLAQAAYDERARKCALCSKVPLYACPVCESTGVIDDGTLDPARLAILSDALEEAGCEEIAVLEPLRAHIPRYRGFHVLDFLLGKA